MACMQVCIVDDSWITRLEAYCKSAGIAEDLGCPNLKVLWFGKGGRRWPSAMADLESLSKTHHPDVIVLHCGGNDLGAIRTVSLILQMKEGLENLLKLFPNSRFLVSEVCQHQKWHFGAIPGSKLEKSRKRLNKEVTTLLHLHGMEVICHANISFRDEKLFLRDGVHLSPEGNAVFLANIQQHFAAPPSWMSVFNAMPTICFGFQCHVSSVPVFNSMKHPEVKTWSWVVTAAMVIALFVYTGTGFPAYAREIFKVNESI